LVSYRGFDAEIAARGRREYVRVGLMPASLLATPLPAIPAPNAKFVSYLAVF